MITPPRAHSMAACGPMMRRHLKTLMGLAGLAAILLRAQPLQEAPTLAIQPEDDSRAVLTWPSSAAAFVLETCGSLAPGEPWAMWPEEPICDGVQYRITLPLTETTTFFRLRDRWIDGLPPDPSVVALSLDPRIANTLHESAAFLYAGITPVQLGVSAETIDPKRVAVLRGQVFGRNATPLPGVTLRVEQHPEYGWTLSRSDGRFDLAVHGGELLTLGYSKAGYLPAQRTVRAGWQKWETVPLVTLVETETHVTTVDLAAGHGAQWIRGSVSSDADGLRQTTLLFPANLEARAVLPDGTLLELSQLGVSATELTVGDQGPTAMPAELPPQVGYTYCVSLVLEEAQAMGATQVVFNKPLPCYVENFLDFPVGTALPVGTYDPQRAVWVPSDDGRVIGFLERDGNLAVLDVDGSGQPATPERLLALGIDPEELQVLAQRYEPGQTFWRVALGIGLDIHGALARIHQPEQSPGGVLLWPLCMPDFNLPIGPNPQAEPPRIPLRVLAFIGELQAMMRPDATCRQEGSSVVEIQNQVLHERIPLAGSSCALHYSSARCPGRRAACTLEFPVSLETIPPGLKQIEVDIAVAGRRFHEVLPAEANRHYHFEWDGIDAYGRRVQGSHPVHVRLGYVYDAYYQNRNDLIRSFGYRGSGVPFSLDPARLDFTFFQEWETALGTWDARGVGLGGWTLDVHHTYDVVGRRLYLGNGRIRAASQIPTTIETVAGGADRFRENVPAKETNLGPKGPGVAMASDGSVYIADSYNARLRRVDTNGVIHTVAGGGTATPGNGVLATAARLHEPWGLALGRDGSLLFSDRTTHCIRKVEPNGILRTVAGTATAGFGGDGGPATAAQFHHPLGIALAPDGNLYVADCSNHRIRQVSPDGVIQTVAGNGIGGFSGDGNSALDASLLYPATVAVGPDGSFYFSSWHNNRIRRVGVDGLIETVAGGGHAPLVTGAAATAVNFAPDSVAVSPDGDIVVTARTPPVLFRVGFDRTVETLAGTGTFGFDGDGGPALQARLGWPVGCCFDQGGNIQLLANDRLRRVGPPLPQFGFGDIAVASADGSQVYQFDARGQHRRTVSALTGARLYEFHYDDDGPLSAIDDRQGNILRVERDGSGKPIAIVSPFGQRTALELDPYGHLVTATDPAGGTVRMSCTHDGLLRSFTDQTGATSYYHYDSCGRLERTEHAAAGGSEITRTAELSAFTVAFTTSEGVSRLHRVEKSPGGETRLLNTSACCGVTNEVVLPEDGTQTARFADGTIHCLVSGPDPRFGMQSPRTVERTLTLPSGLSRHSHHEASVTLQDPTDAFSLESLTLSGEVNGRWWFADYKATDRTWTNRSPAGRETVAALDSRGRIAEVRHPAREPITLRYDTRGRIDQIADGPHLTTFAYDPASGFLAARTNALQHVTSYRRDALGRATNIVLADGNTWQFERDPHGRLLALVEPGGTRRHQWAWTPVHRLESYRSPLGALESFLYDRDRRLTHHVLATGTQIARRYNARNQLVALEMPEGTHTFQYHDQDGHLARTLSADGQQIDYTHDGPLLTRATWNGPAQGTIAYQYNADFLVSHISYGGHHFEVAYDDDGLLTRLGALTLDRHPHHGRPAALTAGAWQTQYEHDAFGLLNRVAVSQGPTLLYDVSVSRDAVGRVLERTETIAGVTSQSSFTYDAVGRLTAVERDGVVIESYAYDAAGNRIVAANVLRGLALNAADLDYDADHRLLRAGSVNWDYDASGRWLRKQDGTATTQYHYRTDGALLRVDLPDGRHLAYQYDAHQRRVARLVDGAVVRRWVYGSGLTPLAEYDGDGQLRTVYLYPGSALPSLFIRNGMAYHVARPGLGSALLITDDNGTVVKRVDYDSFGAVVADSHPAFDFPFGFVGGLADADTGLVRFGVRDYDPQTARWTAKDPLLFAGVSHLYAYAENDPLNRTDRTGMAIEQGLERLAEPTLGRANAPGGADAIPAACELGPSQLAKGRIEGDTNVKSWATGGVKNLLPQGLAQLAAHRNVRPQPNTADNPTPVTGAENCAPSAADLTAAAANTEDEDITECGDPTGVQGLRPNGEPGSTRSVDGVHVISIKFSTTTMPGGAETAGTAG
ncbi:MAG TPA: RHS repeat-associated core domain-containing protein [Verrucomicrobiota bacterium]|nr:RHS repeat-associated core domain-containing protein [Verrucomicrobiota bacterium]